MDNLLFVDTENISSVQTFNPIFEFQICMQTYKPSINLKLPAPGFLYGHRHHVLRYRQGKIPSRKNEAKWEFWRWFYLHNEIVYVSLSSQLMMCLFHISVDDIR